MVIGHVTIKPFPIDGLWKAVSISSRFRGSKRIGGTSLIFQDHVTSVTSRDHLIPQWPLIIDGPLGPRLYSNGFRYIRWRM